MVQRARRKIVVTRTNANVERTAAFRHRGITVVVA